MCICACVCIHSCAYGVYVWVSVHARHLHESCRKTFRSELSSPHHGFRGSYPGSQVSTASAFTQWAICHCMSKVVSIFVASIEKNRFSRVVCRDSFCWFPPTLRPSSLPSYPAPPLPSLYPSSPSISFLFLYRVLYCTPHPPAVKASFPPSVHNYYHINTHA